MTGCKQGGPASPRLFDIYIKPMITELEKLQMGVEIGKLKCEVIMYADDILLLANNDDQMQQLLDVVEQFGKKYQIANFEIMGYSVLIELRFVILPFISRVLLSNQSSLL